MTGPEQDKTTQDNPTLRRDLKDVNPRRIKPWNDEVEQSIIAFFEAANPRQRPKHRGTDFLSEVGLKEALDSERSQE